MLICLVWWAASSWASDPVIVVLKADDLLRFDREVITVSAGSEVKIILKNVGRLTSHTHNFVLLKQDGDVDRFGKEAMGAKVSDYIPAGLSHMVLAKSGLIGPGETAEVKFTAPAKGRYPFLCSYPGHYSLSRGVLFVE